MSALTDPKALLAERQRRLDDAIAGRVPDRVPVIYYTMFWHAHYAGMTIRQAMYDYDALAASMRRAVIEFQPDVVVPTHPLAAVGPAMELLGYRQLRWPGNGVGDNVSYQYIDAEYMPAEDYDDYIEDPSWYYFTKFLPRIADAYKGLAGLPHLAAVQHLRVVHTSRMFAAPQVQESFAQLVKAGTEMQRAFDHMAGFHAELAELGFPLGQSTSCPAPYDYFADYLRGSKGIMLDMFRRKDKLLEAMERAIPIITKGAAAVAQASPCKIVFMPMHWGLDGFMSPAQFNTFFWPQLRKVMIGLIDRGLTPMVLWEGDCTSRLETIADVPAGKCIYMFERTDIFRAKQVLGDIVCIRGNVPASLFNTGTPDDITEYCKKLIKEVGKGGGFILDGGIGLPDEAKPENVRAMFAAAHEYGRYA